MESQKKRIRMRFHSYQSWVEGSDVEWLKKTWGVGHWNGAFSQSATMEMEC